MSLQVGLSCQEFFDNFHSDDAIHPLDKFYASKGAKINFITPWKEPEKVEDKNYNGQEVLKMRTLDADFKVDSKFVKQAPTFKTFRVLEHTETTIKVHSLN